ncbi:hypothetical protein QQF64_011392 [Cirrhinus molitorella]|uniref:DUF4806 domain-containing protein n=1 Tax=Cirrhinus molitorella TaxID=172907 RepID=A0ABR3LZ50_9TELE
MFVLLHYICKDHDNTAKAGILSAEEAICIFKKMFHIVEFSESSEVEVVPSSWVQNKTCVWPSYKSLTKIHKAVTMQECPTPTWTTFRVRILHTTETYQAARQKLPQATLMSDLQTEDDDNDLPSYAKRKNRGNKRPISSESDEEDVVVRKRLDKRSRSEALVELAAAPSIPAPPVTMTEALRTPCRRLDDAVTTPSTSRNSFSPSISEVGDGDRVLDRVLSVLTEVLKEQKVIKQQLSMLLRDQQTQSRNSSASEDLQDEGEFDLPLSDLSNLEKLESELKEQPEKTKKLVAYFVFVGGFSTKEAVWRILGKLLTNSFAKKINWSGANQKVAFRTLALRTVVINAIRTNVHTKSATEKEVEKYITRWLQLAPDRDGGRKQRTKPNNVP